MGSLLGLVAFGLIGSFLWVKYVTDRSCDDGDLYQRIMINVAGGVVLALLWGAL
jgi:hypothetical protein